MNKEIARVAARLASVATAARMLGRNANYEINGKPAALINPEWLTRTSDDLGELADKLLALIEDVEGERSKESMWAIIRVLELEEEAVGLRADLAEAVSRLDEMGAR